MLNIDFPWVFIRNQPSDEIFSPNCHPCRTIKTHLIFTNSHVRFIYFHIMLWPQEKPPLPDFSQNISHGNLALLLSITKGKQFNIKFFWVPFSSTFTLFHILWDINMRKRYQSRIICLPEFQLSLSQHFSLFHAFKWVSFLFRYRHAIKAWPLT